MEIITRLDAAARGLDHFYTGVPCANGHLSERSTRFNHCLACIREATARYRGTKTKPIDGRHARTLPAQGDRLRRRDESREARRAQALQKIRDDEELRRNSPVEIITRQQAKERGLPRYYTGIACENGHLSERMTKSKKCLACHRERRARTRVEQGDKIKAQKAASYRKNREKTLQHQKEWLAANREEVSKRRKAARPAKREQLNAKMREWAKANRPKMRIHERRRRDRERGATGSHTYADIKALEVSQGMLCANPYCKVSLVGGYHIDHIMPIVLDGTDNADNLQLLCGPCNLSKGDLHPVEWLKRQEAEHQIVT